LSNYRTFASSPNLTDAKHRALRFRAKNHGRAGEEGSLSDTTVAIVSPGIDGKGDRPRTKQSKKTAENRQVDTQFLAPKRNPSPILNRYFTEKDAK
jgi:hypothetical protein